MLLRPAWLSKWPMSLERRSDRASRYLGVIALLALILLLASQTGFFSPGYRISHDTASYVGVPGYSEGLSLSNFADRLRLPGLSLFVAAATGGALPHRNAITYQICGNSVLGDQPPCDKVVAPSADLVLFRHDPVVYFFSQQTAADFQRVISAAKLLLIVSFAALYFAMALWINPLLAVLATIALWTISVPSGPSELEIVMTECLFPSLLFLYAATVMMSLYYHGYLWPTLGSFLALYIFFVRPSLIYIDALQVALLLWLLPWRRAWIKCSIPLLPMLAGFIWFFVFSPTFFFAEAGGDSEALRVAILSDESTIDCVQDPELKPLIGAYIYSAYNAPGVLGKWAAVHNDIDRYMLFGFGNVYRFNFPQNPIYSDPVVKPYLGPNGLLPSAVMGRAVAAAAACNRARDANFFVLVTKMVFGLTQPLTPHVPRRFFATERAFYISFWVLCAAIALALARGDLARTIIIAGLVVIHVLNVCIVGLKQGGESRYTFVTEPLYVAAFLFAAAYLLNSVVDLFALFRRRVTDKEIQAASVRI